MTKTIHHPAYVAMIQRLRERRIELGLTQRQVASKLGVPRTWVNKVEKLDRRLDFIETLDLLRAYKIAPAKLAAMIENRP